MSYRTVEMISQQALQGLLKLSPLSSVEEKYIETLQAMMECGVADSGDVIRASGELKSALYIVVSGRVQLRYDGISEPLATLQFGDAFGLLSVLFPAPQEIEVICLEPAKFVSLDEGALRMIELSQPQLAIEIIRAIRVYCAPMIAQLVPLLLKLAK